LIAQFITILLVAGQNKAVYFVLVVTAPEPRPFQKTAKKILAAYFTKMISCHYSKTVAITMLFQERRGKTQKDTTFIQ